MLGCCPNAGATKAPNAAAPEVKAAVAMNCRRVMPDGWRNIAPSPCARGGLEVLMAGWADGRIPSWKVKRKSSRSVNKKGLGYVPCVYSGIFPNRRTAMPAGALADITVLDLTHHIPGPYCTKLLATYGAEVIKIERPGTGDPARQAGPFPGDVPHLEKSGLFLHLNTNKQSVTINLQHARGQALVRELVKQVDVVVENFAPRVLPALGLSYTDLEPLNPRLVMTSISNFGQTGPYRDWRAQDIVIYAMGGAMNLTGLPDRAHPQLALNLMAYQGGNVAAAATMTGVLGAGRLGTGQHIDVSLCEVHAGCIDRRTTSLLGYQYTGEPGYREEPVG